MTKMFAKKGIQKSEQSQRSFHFLFLFSYIYNIRYKIIETETKT